MLEKVKKHGGARSGAGRKPERAYEPIDASMDEIAKRLMQPKQEKQKCTNTD